MDGVTGVLAKELAKRRIRVNSVNPGFTMTEGTNSYHVNPVQLDTKKRQAFAVDSWGGEWHPEFGPKPGDVIVHEHWAQNGFANMDLDSPSGSLPPLGF